MYNAFGNNFNTFKELFDYAMANTDAGWWFTWCKHEFNMQPWEFRFWAGFRSLT